VSVRDDGTGGADFGRGTGLVGLKDRVEALGGRISLHSPRGTGTTLRAEFPLTTAKGGAPASQPVRIHEELVLGPRALGGIR
jgi:signal transduction histidine kinase